MVKDMTIEGWILVIDITIIVSVIVLIVGAYR